MNTIEVPQLLGKKLYRKLVFKPEGLIIEKPNRFMPADLIATEYVLAEKMMAFRYGISWTKGNRLVFARQFFVEISDGDKNICRIKLGSYYGIRKDLYGKLWNDIIHQLWKNYFVNSYNYYYDLYKIHQPFELCGIGFHINGISLNNQLQNTLPWGDIAISSFYHYYTIYSRSEEVHRKNLSFANDWNAVILQMLIKEIVKERNVLQS